MKPFEIVEDEIRRADDEMLEGLLRRVYVGGGFTDIQRANRVLSPQAVRARGKLLCAYSNHGVLVGTVVLVDHDSPARRLAAIDEAEMHLLAVDEQYRGQGIGRALVWAAIESAQQAGFKNMVLWTQPSMLNAHRLYEEAGFVRSSADDFTRDGRVFLVYRRSLKAR